MTEPDGTAWNDRDRLAAAVFKRFTGEDSTTFRGMPGADQQPYYDVVELLSSEWQPDEPLNAFNTGVRSTAAVRAQVASETLLRFADDIEAAYPSDIFIPPTPATIAAAHDLFRGQPLGIQGVDQWTAHVMRHAARLARAAAAVPSVPPEVTG